ncbi:spore cortex-lytic enzyme [Aeribacillus sp. FSL M8-0254]|uniref:spore cortex-lytic enzyme n=1 Tax=Aeribacillus sp. FSL M8-0254 TaxID=2954577 RepID=UPI0030F4F273
MMMGKNMKYLLANAFVLIVFLILSNNQLHVHAFSEQVIQRGATGDDVIELQARLQYNGYYHGKIDGVYGWNTYWAVRKFQNNFGLKEVDGLVGPETKQKLINTTKYYKSFVHEQIRKGRDFTHYGGVPLKIQTAPSEELRAKWRKQTEKNLAKNVPPKKQQAGQAGQGQKQAAPKQQAAQNKQQTGKSVQPMAVNMPGGFSQNDLNLLANAVYGEARGEPYIGQVAVAAVILNRLNSPTFPNTVAGVIFEPGAFTAVSDGQIYLTPNETARKAVMDAINGWDPTEEALYYFNPDTATSPWIWTRPQIKKIGKHIFCE